MDSRIRKAFVLAALLSSTSPVVAQQPFFMGLGDLPGGDVESNVDDISHDGSVVVGSASSSSFPGSPDSFLEVYRSARGTGMVGLGVGDSHVQRVSADGSTVVATQQRLWTTSKGLFTPVPQEITDLRLFSVSGDGSVVSGSVFNSMTQQFDAVRWSEAGGVEYLPRPAGAMNTQAIDISADGSTVLISAFYGTPATDPSLFTWSVADGLVPLDLEIPLSSDVDFTNISDNGKVVTSSIGLNADRRGFRWTKETGAVELGRLPDGPWMSGAGISADGSIIVGNSQNVSPQLPAIWDASHGPRYLEDVLINQLGLGSSLAGWTLVNVKRVSGDGRSVVGNGINPNGMSEGWIAYLGPALAGDFNDDGTVDAADYIVWRKGLGTSHTQAGYNVWRANFGKTSTSGATADLPSSANSPVPEPITHVLAALAIAAFAGQRRISYTNKTIKPSPLVTA